jgi:hypothetical protein
MFGFLTTFAGVVAMGKGERGASGPKLISEMIRETIRARDLTAYAVAIASGAIEHLR